MFHSLLRTYPKKILLLGFIVPLLFSFFFARQVYLVYAHDYSVWKGGGMGMFSSLDHPSKRELYFYTTDEAGNEKQVLFENTSFYGLINDFTTLPHPDLLEQLASAIFQNQLYINKEEGGVLWVSDYQYTENDPAFDGSDIRIELWKMDHVDRKTNELHVTETQSWEL